jgi:hypothetical protein
MSILDIFLVFVIMLAGFGIILKFLLVIWPQIILAWKTFLFAGLTFLLPSAIPFDALHHYFLQHLPRLLKSLHMATRGFPPSTILVNLLTSGELIRTLLLLIFSLSFVSSAGRAFPFLDLFGVGPEGVFSPLLTLDLRFCLTGFEASLLFPFLETC